SEKQIQFIIKLDRSFPNQSNLSGKSYYNQDNEYSFDGAFTYLTEYTRITVYVSGVLVCGIKP
ncbi:MAG TPA: hypothetical protein VHY08_25400, partial [Bacillota bacterium]|nr:hypothetical protein [Bacillota bacterium]